jgi:hypothetical protein
VDQNPSQVGVALAALTVVVWLALGAVIYTGLAVGIQRRWGNRSLWGFWALSAVALSAMTVMRLSSRYIAAGGQPLDWRWGSVLVAFIALATAGACLRIAQVGGRPVRPSAARQALAGCLGMGVVGGALLLAFLVMDVRRFFHQ